QLRALVLAFKTAQIELIRERRGGYPVLLLDDVFSELDNERKGDLLRSLRELPTQIFITTTDLQNVRFLIGGDLNVLEVQKGKLIERDGISGGKSNHGYDT